MAIIRDKVVKGNPSIAIDYIIESHPAFKHYLNRWLFLGDSYYGGYEYYKGKYLEPYYYESKDDYEKRLRQVALDNHVKSICGIYNSFLFRKEPYREYGSISSDPALQSFLQDADLDGRSLQAFLRDANSLAMVYGNVWILVDKPTTQVHTRAEELEQNIRPYVSIFTPDNVLDWEYERQPNGLYQLTYLKVREEVIKNIQYVREYTPTEVNVYKLSGEDKNGQFVETIPNIYGKIPALCLYAQRSHTRGIGISTLGDVADLQKAIYEELSEIEQIIRLTNHPSLVKTADTEAAAGAGSIVQMPQNMDPGLKPYLLQPAGSSIESVLSSIAKKVEAIDRMSCLGGIRSIESRRMSGIGLQTEFQLLNAKLADQAMNLEHAEEQLWRCWALYQGTSFDGEIKYPRSFSIQDKANEVTMLKQAKDSKIESPIINKEIDKKIFSILMEDEADDLLNEIDQEVIQPPAPPLNTTEGE